MALGWIYFQFFFLIFFIMLFFEYTLNLNLIYDFSEKSYKNYYSCGRTRNVNVMLLNSGSGMNQIHQKYNQNQVQLSPWFDTECSKVTREEKAWLMKKQKEDL